MGRSNSEPPLPNYRGLEIPFVSFGKVTSDDIFCEKEQPIFDFYERNAERYERVLDIGSLDVNSTVQGLHPRELLGTAKYYGIDTRKGPGVDSAVSAADYDGKEKYDLVISTETAEHTRDPREIIDCAWRALQPGGLLILTAAGPGRAPHGVDGGEVGDEWYQNIGPQELQGWLEAGGWQQVHVEHDTNAGDVYATARKPKGESKAETKAEPKAEDAKAEDAPAKA